MIVELSIVDELGYELGRSEVEAVSITQEDGSSQLFAIRIPIVEIKRAGRIDSIWLHTPIYQTKMNIVSEYVKSLKLGDRVHLPFDKSPMLTIRKG